MFNSRIDMHGITGASAVESKSYYDFLNGMAGVKARGVPAPPTGRAQNCGRIFRYW